ncbi:hypothetical protein DFQ27_000669 [Actinomortierella ambigua]|uniref:Oligopeptide transporter n=1 Tax=Actinomortierella ambigua TaxID=1343610 RepID=A0A9P6QEI9_9FUNG|nr:hypothetical protein DFQ27_000669 [Actinomortierella ambigua]
MATVATSGPKVQEDEVRTLSGGEVNQPPTDNIQEDFPPDNLPQFTLRSVVVGLMIGVLLCFTNMYFGLQTGWISMMSLQASILSFAIFRALKKHLKVPFGPAENIFLQSTAVATGTLPLAAGFVGIIPALQMMTKEDNPSGPMFLTTGELILWSIAIAFFGVFIAVPLRKQVIVREKLPFPSGTATAQMISVLHHTPLKVRDQTIHPPATSATSTATANTALLRRRQANRLLSMDEEAGRELVQGAPIKTYNSFSARVADTDAYPSGSGSSSPPEGLPTSVQQQQQHPHHHHEHQDGRNVTEAGAVEAVEEDFEIEGEGGQGFKLNKDFSSGETWATNMWALGLSFFASGTYTVLSYFFPVVGAIPIFDWLTGNTVTIGGTWQWFFTPSLSYIGQGIIMGFPTTASMLLGCVVGWGILSPIATKLKWVTGPVSSSNNGARGWILWVSLGVMIAEAVVSLLVVVTLSLISHYRYRARVRRLTERAQAIERARAQAEQTGHADDAEALAHEIELARREEEDDAPESELVPLKMWVIGLILSSALCLLLIWVIFKDQHMPVYATLLALVLGSLLSVLGVRALGSTDLNPVSGIGKVSQFVFAGVVPGNIVANLIAGGIAEAGAQQAGDLMQDLKTGHLMGASPKAQFYGQLIGSVASVFISTGVYQLYSNAYSLPSSTFPVPTAQVWLQLARLVNGQSLPQHTGPFIWGFAALFSVLTLISSIFSDTTLLKTKDGQPRTRPHWVAWIPNGIAFAIGMYNLPNFTLARFIGGVISLWWDHHCAKYAGTPKAKYAQLGRVFLIIIASGFVLGEGTFSIVNLVLKTAKVPSASCKGCYAGMCSCN